MKATRILVQAATLRAAVEDGRPRVMAICMDLELLDNLTSGLHQQLRNLFHTRKTAEIAGIVGKDVHSAYFE